MIGIARLTRRRLSAALFVICIDFAAMPVHAQLAPSQPIKIVVGVPAGGLGDLAARILEGSAKTGTRQSLKTASAATASSPPTRSQNRGRTATP